MILIVDDSPTVRLVLGQQLRALGIGEVRAPATLAEAWQLLGCGPGEGVGRTDVALLLLDMVMPEMDGLSFLRALRAWPHLQDLSVLMVTGVDSDSAVAEALDTGANDYLTKPYSSVVLRARVQNGLRATHALRERDARERELLSTQQALEQANARLEALALTDGLTGLSNRRALDEALEREVMAARRSGQPLGVLLLDIDHFKPYNDHWGHPAGDACLQRVARALAGVTTRATDLVARYGGEEFALLLPATDAAGLAVVAERVCERVRALCLPHPTAAGGAVTVSVGGAGQSGSAHGSAGALISDLLRRADAALYRAKQSGRNRVMLDGE